VDLLIPHLRELEHLIEKHFHGLFSKKKTPGGFELYHVSEVNFFHKNFPTRLPGLLEKRSKIWRYGCSWKLVGKKYFEKCRKWIRLPAKCL